MKWADGYCSENLDVVLVTVMIYGRSTRLGGRWRCKDILDESWSDSLARTAPGRECIHDHDIVLLEGGVELSLAI